MPAFSVGAILDSRKLVKQHSLMSSLDSKEEEFVETNGSESSYESASRGAEQSCTFHEVHLRLYLFYKLDPLFPGT